MARLLDVLRGRGGSAIEAGARAGRSRYLLALVLITPLMMILIGSLRVGFVSMVPNLVPILVTLALIVPMHRKR